MLPLNFSKNKPDESGIYFVLFKINEMSIVKMARVEEKNGEFEVEIQGKRQLLQNISDYNWSQKVN